MASETKGVVKSLPPETGILQSSVYYWKIRKIYDMEKHFLTRYSPDAFFLGYYGFQAHYLLAHFSYKIKLCLCMTHFSVPLTRAIQGRILIVDANNEEKKQTILLKEDIRNTTDDWARGLEIEFDILKWKDYAVDGSYILRFEIAMI